MNKIKDKHLLAILDLMNLEMEVANIGREFEENGKITEYHNIYTFLQAQYEWLDLMKKENFQLEPVGKSYWDFQDKNKRSKRAGFYYDIYEDKAKTILKERIFSYSHKEILTKEAPIITEYFDRYQENLRTKAVSPDKHAGHFTTEIEMIFGGDLYTIAYNDVKDTNEAIILFNNFQKLLIKTTCKNEIAKNAIISYIDAANKKLKEEINDFPSRDNVQAGRIAHYLKDRVLNIISSDNVKINISNIALDKFITMFCNAFNAPLDMVNTFLTFMGTSKPEEINNFFYIGDDKSTYIGHSMKYTYKKNISKKNFKIGCFKYTKKKTIIIAIDNNKDLQGINSDLNNGKLPNELFLLESLHRKLRGEYPKESNWKFIYTGEENAGKLATILGIFFDEDFFTFYKNKPYNIKSSVDFDTFDLTDLNNKYQYSNEVTISTNTSDSILYGLGFTLITTVGKVSLTVKYSTIFLCFTLISISVVGISIHLLHNSKTIGGKILWSGTLAVGFYFTVKSAIFSLTLMVQAGIAVPPLLIIGSIAAVVGGLVTYKNKLKLSANVKSIVDLLVTKGVISSIDSKLKDGRILGEIQEKYLKTEKVSYGNLKMDLKDYLFLICLEKLEGWKLVTNTDNLIIYEKSEALGPVAQDVSMKIFLESGKIIEVKRIILQTRDAHSEHKMDLEVMIQPKDTIGILLYSYMEILSAMQKQYKKRISDSVHIGYYFGNDKKPVKDKIISLKYKEQDGNKFPDISQDFFPYVGDDGEIKKEINEKFIGSLGRAASNLANGKKEI